MTESLRPDWLPAAFSKVVQRRREFLGISQEVLSQRSGLHRTYISDIERGARNVSLTNMSKLATALELAPSDLIRWAELRTAGQRAGEAVEGELTRLLARANFGYFLLDVEGLIINCNDAAADWLGHERQELVGAVRFSELLSEPCRQKLEASLSQSLPGRSADNTQLELVPHTASTPPKTAILSAVADEGGNCIMWRLFLPDANQTAASVPRKSCLQQESLERALYASLIESSDDAIGAVQEGKFVSWNRGAERLLGYSAREAIGQSVFVLLTPTDRMNEHQRLLQELESGRRLERYETALMRKDGVLVDVLLSLHPIFNESGAYVGISGIATDITESRQLQRRTETQLEIVSALEESDTFDQVAPRILQAVCLNNRFEHGALWMANASCDRLELYERYPLKSADEALPNDNHGNSTFHRGEDLPGFVWDGSTALWIDNIQNAGPDKRHDFAKEYGFISGFWLPLNVAGQVVGVFEFLSRTTRPEDKELLLLMATMSQRIGRFIVRSRSRVQKLDSGAS